MIVEVLHKTGESSATAYVGDGHNGPAYKVHVPWTDSRSAVQTVLALLGADTAGPVLVHAGEIGGGTRWLVLNGPASLFEARRTQAELSMPTDSILAPVVLATPTPLQPGERVQLHPAYWPSCGQWGTVVSRVGKMGVSWRVALDSGTTKTLVRGAVL